MRKFLLALALLALACQAQAQTPLVPLVQQSSQRLDAATTCFNGSSYNTVANQSTATITAVAGQYFYITWIYLAAANDATGVVNTNLNFTSTGIVGTPQWGYSQVATADAGTIISQGPLSTPLRTAAPGTAATIVSPASQTHTGFAITVCGYYSP